MNTVTYDDIKREALEEWKANLELGYIVVPFGWDKDLWLEHMASRVVYIFRVVGGEFDNSDPEA